MIRICTDNFLDLSVKIYLIRVIRVLLRYAFPNTIPRSAIRTYRPYSIWRK